MNDDKQELQMLRKRLARLDVLYQVSNVIHTSLDPEESLTLIISEAARVTNATSGSVALINPNTGFLEILATYGLPSGSESLRLRVGEGITGWVAQNRVTARVGNVQEDDRYILLGRNVHSELAVPLCMGDKISGVINVDSEYPDAFSEEDEELLEELAIQASSVIRNSWKYEQLRLKAGMFETLIEVGKSVNSELNLDDVLRTITRQARQMMSAKLGSLLLVDSTGERLELKASHGAGPDYIDKPSLPIKDSLLGTVVRRKKPIQLKDVQTSNRYQHLDVARSEGLISLLSVPLIYQKKVLGTLVVYSEKPHRFSDDEINILSTLADLSSLAIEKARLYERIVDAEEHLRQNEKLSALGLLAAEVSHEIRNPLTVMKMVFHALDLKFPEGDPRQEDTRILGEKMDQLNTIVEQILTFARNAEPQKQRIDINRVIGDLLYLIRHKLSQQGINLIRDLEPALRQAEADQTQLHQAFLNLALNAIEAMPEGGTLTISTRTIMPEEGHIFAWPKVQITITDTGQGLDEEQQKALFSSLLSTTKSKGTGLGLAIVTKIIEAHGGTMEVNSKEGKGTSFTILLPADE
ncbi:GAF domain-containing protein [Verrucomicrobia bacterium]|nr:GAF domain-containing protein [Verrucomicrobiota bacterium]